MLFACLQKGSAARGLLAKEKERVGLYRQKTKAALVIQLAWRRYARKKKHQLALEAHSKVLQVCMCLFENPCGNCVLNYTVLSV